MYDRYTIDDKIHINKGPTVYLQFNLRTLAFAGLDCQCHMWAYFDECPWEKCETRSRRQWRKHESGRGTKSSASQLGRFGLRSLDFLFASRIFCFCVNCLDASEWQQATERARLSLSMKKDVFSFEGAGWLEPSWTLQWILPSWRNLLRRMHQLKTGGRVFKD